LEIRDWRLVGSLQLFTYIEKFFGGEICEQHGQDAGEGRNQADGKWCGAKQPDGEGHQIDVQWFTTVIALKKDGPACRFRWIVAVCILGVQLPPFIKLREHFALHQREGIQAVVRFVMVEAGGEGV
jgi:hypothetical protein